MSAERIEARAEGIDEAIRVIGIGAFVAVGILSGEQSSIPPLNICSSTCAGLRDVLFGTDVSALYGRPTETGSLSSSRILRAKPGFVLRTSSGSGETWRLTSKFPFQIWYTAG
jgi:hypothetical protein